MQSIPPCVEFCCSDVAQLQEELAAISSGDIIDTTIHPLLAHSRWDHASDGDHVELDLSLRLATKIIESDAFAKFVMTIVDGDVFETSSSGRKGKRTSITQIDQEVRLGLRTLKKPFALYPKAADSVVNDRVRWRRDMIMLNMSYMVDWKVDTLPRGLKGLTGQSGAPWPPQTIEMFSHGGRSTITINSTLVDQQRAMRRDDPNDNDLFMTSLNLTVVILHELSHAMYQAVYGYGRLDPYFGSSKIGEIGFEMEKRIFGGHIAEFGMPYSGQFPHDSRIMNGYTLSFVEWPSPVHAAAYANIGCTSMSCRMNEKPYAMFARLPASHVLPLFTKSWWLDVAPTLGSKPYFQATSFPRWLVRYKETDGISCAVLCSPREKSMPKKLAVRFRRIAERQFKRQRPEADIEFQALRDTRRLREQTHRRPVDAGPAAV